MAIKDLLREMIEKGASDLFCRAASVPRLRVDGKLVSITDKVLTVEDILAMVEELIPSRQREVFQSRKDIDFALYLEELKRRFRVSIFMQRNSPAIVVRNTMPQPPSLDSLGLPAEVLKQLCHESRGLILLTGAAGSGKSTTIAAMLDYINENFSKHILTIEEPIEIAFKDKKSLINQRELGLDVFSYEAALHAFTLQSPDIIYIGNIRDSETMSAVLNSAESGVLVFSTLHTVNAPQTIERIINFFPPHQHPEVRLQLSLLLKGVISLRLLPRKDGSGRIPAAEIMLLTPTIARLIREGQTWEIPRYIEEGGVFGMQSFNQALVALVKENKVNIDDAIYFADNKEELQLTLKGIRHA